MINAMQIAEPIILVQRMTGSLVLNSATEHWLIVRKDASRVVIDEMDSNGICAVLILGLARMAQVADGQVRKGVDQNEHIHTKKDRPVVGGYPSDSIFLVCFVFDRPICA